MPSSEVVVVGAGPAGSTVAERLARAGHEVALLEEHGRVGHPVQCAGLVSQRVIDLAGTDRFVRHAVEGATVFGPGSARVSFRAGAPKAFVIDRAGLDIHLAERAAAAGATVRAATKFVGLSRPSGEGPLAVRLLAAQGTAEPTATRLLIGADGVASAVARSARLRRPVEILPAFEAEFPNAPIDPREVEVYLGRRIAPGLFGWSIPDGLGGARIGVAVDADGTSARHYFERLLDRIEELHGQRPRGATSLLVSGIPIGRLPAVSADRVMLIGDAAAQVKPVSGGGIFLAMRCAEIAAEVAHGALSEDEPTAERLALYDRRVREELGDELDRALALRRLFVRLNDRELDRVVRALDRAELTGTIVAFGDIDFPSGLAVRLLRQSPSLLALVPKALGALVGASGRAAPELDPGPRRSMR